MKRKFEEVQVEDDDGDVQVIEVDDAPTQQDDMRGLHESMRGVLGVGCANRLWADKGFQKTLSTLIRHEKKRTAEKYAKKAVEISLDVDAISTKPQPVFQKSEYHATVEQLSAAKWDRTGVLPASCTHLLVLDIENVRNLFYELAVFEVEKQLEVIPKGCYVFAAWGNGNRIVHEGFKGHIIERLIATNRLQCDSSGTTPNAADTVILSTMVDLLMGELNKKVPITLVSSDKDFNELHVMATVQGYSYNRILSFDDTVIWDNPVRSHQWITLFCEQLRSRLHTRSNRRTLPKADTEKWNPSGDYKLDFLNQTSIFKQLQLQDYFRDPHSGAKPRLNRRHQYPWCR